MKQKVYKVGVWLLLAMFPAPARSGISLKMEALPWNVPTEGDCLITVSVCDEQSKPVANGTEVSFTASLGEIPASAVTRAGQAKVLLRSRGITGTSEVTARVGDVSQSVHVSFANEPRTFFIERNLQWVPADGESTVIIRAQAPMAPDGTPISFETSQGYITPQATTQKGVAMAVLRSHTLPGTPTVAATCGGRTVLADEPIHFVPMEPASIQLTASALRLVADGQTSIPIYAIMFDPDLQRMLHMNGRLIHLQTDNGHLLHNDVQTFYGTASTTFTVPDKPGLARISARYAELIHSLEIVLTDRPTTVQIELLLPVSKLPSGAHICRVRATARDPEGKSVGYGAPVIFETTGGNILWASPTTDQWGIAEAAVELPADTSDATVTVTVGEKVASDMDIDVEGLPSKSIQPVEERRVAINVSPGEVRLLPNGRLACEIFARVTTDDKPLSYALVTFSATAGTLVPAQVRTGEHGVAQTTLMCDERRGEVLVRASYGEATHGTTVELRASDPTTIEFSVFPHVLQAGGSGCSLVRAYFKDHNGERVFIPHGMTVDYSVDAGKFQPWDLLGAWASLHVWPRPDPGLLTVQAVCGNLRATTQLICAGPPHTITLQAHPTTFAKKHGRCFIRAIVRDAQGYPVADGTVIRFSTDHGQIAQMSTTQDGEATVSLQSATSAECHVRATAGEASADATVVCR